MTTITDSPIFSAALAVVASAAMLTFAVAPAEAASVVVKISTQDLTTAEGRAAVDARLERAAKRACGFSHGREALATKALAQACVAKALADARTQMAGVKARTQMVSK